MQILTKYKWFIFVFVLALVCRLAYLGLSLEAHGNKLLETISGADCYYTLSENIIHGNGYSCEVEPPYSLNAVRPPIYPYFLALLRTLFGSYLGVVLVQILLGAALPLLAMKIASYLFPGTKIPLVAGILLALEPMSILFSTFFYSETVCTFLLLSSVLALFSYFKRHALLDLVLAATLMAASVLTKPTLQYFFVVVCFFLLFEAGKRITKRQIYAAVTFGVVFLLVLSPWLYRNYALFGHFKVSALQDAAISVALTPSVLAIKNGTTFQEEFAKALARGEMDPNSADFSSARGHMESNVRMLVENPVPLLLLTANTSINFFIHDGMYDVLKHVGIRPDQYLGKPALFLLLTEPVKFMGFIAHYITTPVGLILVGRILWIMLTVLMVVGMLHQCIKRPSIHLLVLVTLVAYFLVTTLVVGLGVNARYRVPVDGIILMFAVSGAYILYTYLRAKIGRVFHV